MRRFCAAACFIAAITVAWGDTIHVPADQPTIQRALFVASPGDQIVIAPGVYAIGSGLVYPGSDIALCGESGNAEDTILDGGGMVTPVNLAGRVGLLFKDLTFTHCDSAVKLSACEAEFRGCRFVNNTSSAANPYGALVMIDSQVDAFGCTFEGHSTTNASPGGAASAYGGRFHVFDSLFQSNYSASGTSGPSSSGGAVFLGVLSLGSNNHVGADFRAERCVFNNNEADLGGAIGSIGATMVIDRCRFNTNFSTLGGAILVREDATVNPALIGQATITNSVFNGNLVWRFQGSTNGLGAAIATTSQVDVSAINNTFHANHAEASGGVGYWFPGVQSVELANNIYADNVPNNYAAAGGVTESHNLSGTAAGIGFADPRGPDNELGTADDDVSLLPGSPAIDAGDNTMIPAPVMFDYDGYDRLVDDPATPDTGVGPAPIVDIGAYEFQPPLPCSIADLAPPFGLLDFFDVQVFLGLFSAHNPTADLNTDGLFDFFDVQVFLNVFSQGC